MEHLANQFSNLPIFQVAAIVPKAENIAMMPDQRGSSSKILKQVQPTVTNTNNWATIFIPRSFPRIFKAFCFTISLSVLVDGDSDAGLIHKPSVGVARCSA